VSGQLFFKHAMSNQVNSPRWRRFLDLGAGVLAMTVGFFTWLALLHRFDLSFLYPFEGLDRVLLALGAWLFLREKNDNRSLDWGDLDLSRNDLRVGQLIGAKSSWWPAEDQA
jgi:hypothetical protein